ncbi:hypothetical protein N665_0103s0017 [Sinapis alba]|nr:hypothetical protein N665_0103s0017 [Sinapis alba]
MSFKVLCSDSKACLCVIGASSQIIRYVFSISSASIVPGILMRECAVLAFGSSNAAIPDEATGRTICFLDRSLDIRVWYKKVLPVPPAPFTKNNFPCFFSIDSKTTL